MATYQIHKESMKIPCKVNDIAVISYGNIEINGYFIENPKDVMEKILEFRSRS